MADDTDEFNKSVSKIIGGRAERVAEEATDSFNMVKKSWGDVALTWNDFLGKKSETEKKSYWERTKDIAAVANEGIELILDTLDSLETFLNAIGVQDFYCCIVVRLFKIGSDSRGLKYLKLLKAGLYLSIRGLTINLTDLANSAIGLYNSMLIAILTTIVTYMQTIFEAVIEKLEKMTNDLFAKSDWIKDCTPLVALVEMVKELIAELEDLISDYIVDLYKLFYVSSVHWKDLINQSYKSMVLKKMFRLVDKIIDAIESGDCVTDTSEADTSKVTASDLPSGMTPEGIVKFYTDYLGLSRSEIMKIMKDEGIKTKRDIEVETEELEDEAILKHVDNCMKGKLSPSVIEEINSRIRKWGLE